MEKKQEVEKEVKERSRGGEKERAERRTSSSGAVQMTTTDMRYREVKEEN